MKIFKTTIFAIAVATVGLTACSQDDSLSSSAQEDRVMKLDVKVAPETRGIKLTSESFRGVPFGITGIKHDNVDNPYGVSQNSFAMYNKRVDRTTGVWAIKGPTYLWPEDGYITFYAYSPYVSDEKAASGDSLGIQLHGTNGKSGEQAEGPVVITYNIPQNLEEQPDLMTAIDYNHKYVIGGTATIPLTFTHALSAISFRVTQMPAGTIKSITLRNVYMGGDYRIDSLKWDFSKQTRKDYTVELNKSIEANATQNVTNSSQVFLMVPQKFNGTGQGLEIVFNDGSQDYTLTYSLNGSEWPRGKSIVYNITINSLYEVDVDFKIGAWEDADKGSFSGNANVEHK